MEEMKKDTDNTCSFCHKSFSAKTNRDTHIRAVHSDNRPLKCSISKKCFSCKVCLRSFRRLDTLYKHMRKHAVSGPLVCSVCKMSFSTESKLFHHIKIRSHERPFTCTICKKVFRYQVIFNRHMANHSTKTTFRCIMCEKIFNHAYLFNKHMQCHDHEKAVPCDKYRRSFKRKYDFGKHLKTHSDNTHGCQVCKKSFKYKSELDQHVISHKAERPFTCTTCKMSFKCIKHLVQHVKGHSDERTFTWQRCKKSFKRRSHLNRHIKSNCKDRKMRRVRPRRMGVRIKVEKRYNTQLKNETETGQRKQDGLKVGKAEQIYGDDRGNTENKEGNKIENTSKDETKDTECENGSLEEHILKSSTNDLVQKGIEIDGVSNAQQNLKQAMNHAKIYIETENEEKSKVGETLAANRCKRKNSRRRNDKVFEPSKQIKLFDESQVVETKDISGACNWELKKLKDGRHVAVRKKIVEVSSDDQVKHDDGSQAAENKEKLETNNQQQVKQKDQRCNNEDQLGGNAMQEVRPMYKQKVVENKMVLRPRPGRYFVDSRQQIKPTGTWAMEKDYAFLTSNRQQLKAVGGRQITKSKKMLETNDPLLLNQNDEVVVQRKKQMQSTGEAQIAHKKDGRGKNYQQTLKPTDRKTVEESIQVLEKNNLQPTDFFVETRVGGTKDVIKGNNQQQVKLLHGMQVESKKGLHNRQQLPYADKRLTSVDVEVIGTNIRQQIQPVEEKQVKPFTSGAESCPEEKQVDQREVIKIIDEEAGTKEEDNVLGAKLATINVEQSLLESRKIFSTNCRRRINENDRKLIKENLDVSLRANTSEQPIHTGGVERVGVYQVLEVVDQKQVDNNIGEGVTESNSISGAKCLQQSENCSEGQPSENRTISKSYSWELVEEDYDDVDDEEDIEDEDYDDFDDDGNDERLSTGDGGEVFEANRWWQPKYNYGIQLPEYKNLWKGNSWELGKYHGGKLLADSREVFGEQYWLQAQNDYMKELEADRRHVLQEGNMQPVKDNDKRKNREKIDGLRGSSWQELQSKTGRVVAEKRKVLEPTIWQHAKYNDGRPVVEKREVLGRESWNYTGGNSTGYVPEKGKLYEANDWQSVPNYNGRQVAVNRNLFRAPAWQQWDGGILEAENRYALESNWLQMANLNEKMQLTKSRELVEASRWQDGPSYQWRQAEENKYPFGGKRFQHAKNIGARETGDSGDAVVGNGTANLQTKQSNEKRITESRNVVEANSWRTGQQSHDSTGADGPGPSNWHQVKHTVERLLAENHDAVGTNSRPQVEFVDEKSEEEIKENISANSNQQVQCNDERQVGENEKVFGGSDRQQMRQQNANPYEPIHIGKNTEETELTKTGNDPDYFDFDSLWGGWNCSEE